MAWKWWKFKRPKTRRRRLMIYLLGTPVLLLAADMALVQYWRWIPVSRETTFVTTLDAKSGRPDYLGWWNDQMRDGVTPENNAAIPLAAIVGRLPTEAAKK